MKPEEAISAIKNNMPTKGTYTILTEGLELAVQALEKQVAKNPILCGENPDGTYQFRCSDCGRLWWEKSHITKYCDGCGSATDRGADV